MKLGKPKYFLGIEVAYSKQDIFISKIGELGCKNSRILIELNHKIECKECPTNPLVFEGKYRKRSIVQKRRYISVKIYINGDYAEPIIDFGYCMFLGRNLVTWWRKKQNVVIILDYLKVKYEGSMKLFCDNKLAISIVYNLVQHDRIKHIQHDRIKHIQIDKHFIKEKLNGGTTYTYKAPSGRCLY
ncbi:hypothetical protein CR513_32101, partial [Mucuna pruriens]